MKSLVNAVRGRKLADRVEVNKATLAWLGHRWLEAFEAGNLWGAALLLGFAWDAVEWDLALAEGELRGEPVNDLVKSLNWNHRREWLRR